MNDEKAFFFVKNELKFLQTLCKIDDKERFPNLYVFFKRFQTSLNLIILFLFTFVETFGT